MAKKTGRIVITKHSNSLSAGEALFRMIRVLLRDEIKSQQAGSKTVEVESKSDKNDYEC